MDVVNDVAGHDAESSTEAAYDPGLFAMRDGIVLHHVVTDVLLSPGDGKVMSPFNVLDLPTAIISLGVAKLIAMFT